MMRDAEAEGAFEGLAGRGRPIEGIDRPYDENWWIKRKLEQEKVSAVPEAIRLRREVDARVKRLPECGLEEALRIEVREINALIQRANAAPAPMGGLAVLAPLDADAMVEVWLGEQ